MTITINLWKQLYSFVVVDFLFLVILDRIVVKIVKIAKHLLMVSSSLFIIIEVDFLVHLHHSAVAATQAASQIQLFFKKTQKINNQPLLFQTRSKIDLEKKYLAFQFSFYTYENNNDKWIEEIVCKGAIDVIEFFHVPDEVSVLDALEVRQHDEEVDADTGQKGTVEAAALEQHLLVRKSHLGYRSIYSLYYFLFYPILI